VNLFENTALIDTLITNRDPQHSYNKSNRVVDGDTTELGRWASYRCLSDTLTWDTVYYMNLKHFSDSLNILFANAGNDSILNDIINNTVYFDTVYFTIVLNEPALIDRLVLYLGYHRQIFDVEVSTNGTDWTLLKPEDYNVIN
jgi:hypothetical protein